MKRVAMLLALGVTTSVSFAQSTSAQLYGLVDLSVLYLRSGSQSTLAGGHATREIDGTVYGPGSRWGLRVKEDLGDGLASGVLIEQGFLADTGQLGQGGRGFGRQAYIWIGSDKAGEFRMGRQYMLHDEAQAITNPTIGTTVLNPSGIYTLKTGNIQPFLSAPRIDNAVKYLSPVFGGFRAQLMGAASEGTQDRYQAAMGTYNSGPVLLTLAYEQSRALVLPASGDRTTNKVLIGGGSYDFGPVKLWAAAERGKNLTTGAGTQIGTLTIPGLPTPATDLKSYDLSVSSRVGLTELMAVYTHAKFSSASGADVSVARYGAGATYFLSKRTQLFGIVALAGGSLKENIEQKRAVQVGFRNVF